MDHTEAAHIKTLLASRDWHAVRRVLAELHAADIAELIDVFEEEEEAILFRLLGRRKGEVFAYLGPEQQRRIIRGSDPQQLSRMVTQMSPDDRTRVLEELPTPVAHTLLGRLPPSEITQALTPLRYPANT